MTKKTLRIAGYILLSYCITGLIYSAAGYIYRGMIGKQEVFSAWIAIPFDIVGWSWMVYADVKHIGMGIQDVLALISMMLCVVLFLRKELHLNRDVEDGGKKPIQ